MKELDSDDLYPINKESNLGKLIIDQYFPGIEEELSFYRLTKNEYLNRLTLCSYVVSKSWRGQEVDSKAILNFITSLKSHLILLSFPRILESFRIMKMFEYSSSSCIQLAELVMICLTECYNKSNISVPLDIINLSVTFYCKKSSKIQSCEYSENEIIKEEINDEMNEVISDTTVETDERISSRKESKNSIDLNCDRSYLNEEIKSHKIFSKAKFWETCLVYSLKLSKDRFDFHDVRLSVDSQIIKENYIAQISRTFMSQIMHMKEFGYKRKATEELIVSYSKKYKLPNYSVKEMFDFIEMSYGKEGGNRRNYTQGNWKIVPSPKKDGNVTFKTGVSLLGMRQIGTGF